MAPYSMTGFARSQGEGEHFSWQWEMRSVNGRGLDVRLRLPGGFDALEPEVRKRIAARLKRGSVQVSLQVRTREEAQALRVNRALLEALMREALNAARRLEMQADVRLDVAGLMNVRGVVETAQVDLSALAQDQADVLLAGLEEALEALLEMRAEEGRRLACVIAGQMDEVERLVGRARAHPALDPGNIRARLKEQVARLLEASEEALDAQRLHQEAALLAVKADITEELDRLEAHVAAVRALLQAGEPVGRKLEFLAQEFNREANTLCSKAVDAAITDIGVALKTVIDQFREQVANIE